MSVVAHVVNSITNCTEQNASKRREESRIGNLLIRMIPGRYSRMEIRLEDAGVR